MLPVSPHRLCRRPEIWADGQHHLSPGAPEPLEPGPAWPLRPRPSPAAAWGLAFLPRTGRASAERPGRPSFAPPPEGHHPELQKEKAGPDTPAAANRGRAARTPPVPRGWANAAPGGVGATPRAPGPGDRGASPRRRPRLARLRAETAALPPVSRVLSADVAAAVTAGGGTAARGTDGHSGAPWMAGRGRGCGLTGKAGHWGAGAGPGPRGARKPALYQGVRSLNRRWAHVRTTDLNSSWMAGSTGTAERGKETLISLPSLDPPPPLLHPTCHRQPPRGPDGGLLQDGGDPSRAPGAGRHGRTSDPFGSRAMPLLLGVHLHLQGEKAVSVLPCWGLRDSVPL